MSGRLLQRNISKVFQNKLAADIAEAAILLLLGVVAISLHARFKTHLGLPGNQGIIFIALVMSAKLTSNFKSAASLSCLSASILSFFPFWGFQNIFFPLTFMLPGLYIDLAFSLSGKLSSKLWFASIIGGIAYCLIPIARVLISLVTGIPFNVFLKYGFFLPVASHFLFGFIGAFISATAISYFLKNK